MEDGPNLNHSDYATTIKLDTMVPGKKQKNKKNFQPMFNWEIFAAPPVHFLLP